MSLSELKGALQAAGADRHDPLGGVTGHRGDELIGDPAGADHAPAEAGDGSWISGTGLGQGVGHQRSIPGNDAQSVGTVPEPVYSGRPASPGSPPEKDRGLACPRYPGVSQVSFLACRLSISVRTALFPTPCDGSSWMSLAAPDLLRAGDLLDILSRCRSSASLLPRTDPRLAIFAETE